jgi:hypothetical protein
MADEAIDELAVLETLEYLASRKDPIEFKMSVYEMHILLSSVQLTVTHPGLHQPLTDHLRAVGGRLQEQIGCFTDDEFRRFLEAGWHREFDR